MKKSKSALGLIAIVAACAALSGCNKPTYDANGSIFTYTDANGQVISYSTKDLLESYQEAGSSASTEFDKVYEVLVRKYYQSDSMSTKLSELSDKAHVDVETSKQKAQQSADSNGTSYEEEFEKILTTAGVENEDELYQQNLYTAEKTDFENTYNTNNRNAMRDGSTDGLTSTNYLFGEDENYGRASKGWIKETMPYHVRHILVKVSASSGAYTQGQLTEATGSDAGEATKLATTIMRIAGADTTTGTTNAISRETFGEIAKNTSDDTSSSSAYGETQIVTKSTGFVPEFKLGMYAYESLYNQKNVTSTDSYTQSVISSVTPGLNEDEDTVNTDETLSDGTTINQYFKNGESYDDGNSGIGQIPYGAAVALLKYAKTTSDSNGNPVYESNATYYPRNVLFNKYFNKHNICVITPNKIASNIDDSLEAKAIVDDKDGVASTEYEALKGFQTDTTDVLPQFTNNVLTNSEGQIVLVARAGSSDYQGVHFIVIQRSALDNSSTADTPNLSQYYTMNVPSDTDYPKTSAGKAMDTYINYNKQLNSDHTTRQGTIIDDVKNYNTSLSTYIFKNLVDTDSIHFTSSTMESRIQTYSKTKRQSEVDDAYSSWNTDWKSYAELIESQDEARNATFDFKTSPADTEYYTGSASAKNRMLSEAVVCGYSNPNRKTDLVWGSYWNEGGECYYVK